MKAVNRRIQELFWLDEDEEVLKRMRPASNDDIDAINMRLSDFEDLKKNNWQISRVFGIRLSASAMNHLRLILRN